MIAAVPTTVKVRSYDDASSLALKLQTEQPERWQAFHANKPRILIIDDNQGTLDRLESSLSILYGGEITTTPNPIAGLRMIRRGKETRIPYDVVILDLHMPKMSGLELMKAAGADCPPTVFHTASMMKPKLADLKIQMDNFTAANALALLDQHVNEGRSALLPLAATMVALKDQPLRMLVDKIDSVLLIGRARPDSAQLNQAFLKVYEPELVQPTTVALNVHEISESLINALSEIVPIINKLKAEGLESTPWWKTNGARITTAIKACEKTFTDFNLENAQTAWSQIHTLLNDFMNIEPTDLSFASSPQLVDQWKGAFYKHRNIIGHNANKLRNYAHGKIELDKVVEKICSEVGISCSTSYLRLNAESYPIMDQDRTLSSFLANVIRNFSSRMENSEDSRKFISVDLHFKPGSSRLSEDEKRQKILTKIGAGDYFTLVLADNSGKNLEESFADLLPEFGRLRNEKKIAWQIEYDDQSTYAQISIFIKASEDSLNFESYLEQLAKISSSPKEIIPELNGKKELHVYEISNVFCLGALPGELDYKCATGKADTVLGHVYNFEDQAIFASGFSHKEAASTILAYLKLKKETINLTAEDIYQKGTRVTISGDSKINIETESDPTISQAARETIIKLGTMDSRVIIDKGLFEFPKPVQDESVLRLGQFDRKILDNIIKIFGEDIIADPTLNKIVDSYTAVFNMTQRFDEPSFIIRSRQGLDLPQLRELTNELAKILTQVNSTHYDIDEWGGHISLSGMFARKSGIYLYDSKAHRQIEFSGCPFAANLKALVDHSSTLRLFSKKIIRIEDRIIPDNSLVFGGGDHTLSACYSQATISCGLEIILQRLGVSYDVCRGRPSDTSFYEHFDGHQFHPLNTQKFT